MKDPSSTVLDHKEAIQGVEGRARNGEEVERRDDFAVIIEKGQPLFSFPGV